MQDIKQMRKCWSKA